MEIPIDVQHWFEPATSLVDNAYALRALLDCLITLNESYLRNHSVRPLYQSGVVYGRTTVWDPIPALYARQYGDCKSLSAALIAQYRKQGIACEPTFRWHPRKNTVEKILDFHILVEVRRSGKIIYEDPSKVLGMGADEVAPIEPRSQFHRGIVGMDPPPQTSSWLTKLGLGR
jgi:hypothetical protein